MKIYVNILTALEIIIICCIFNFQLFAQSWLNAANKPISNFYEIQRNFNSYWKGKDTNQKGIGLKQFRRWEWFWQQRVQPSGEFPDPMQLLKEKKQWDLKYHEKNKDNLLTANWNFMGPNSSPGGYAGLGRVNVVRQDPSNSNIIWAGSASGGLWKSTDGGSSWQPKTDYLPSIGITDIAFHPNNSSIIYIATGDADHNDTYSTGVMVSTNSGSTWNTTGLNWETSLMRNVSRLLIDPSNPDIMYACGNNGIYKSTNAGLAWGQVFTGSFRDMEFKPGSPNIIYAAGIQIFKTQNGGDTWNQLTNGLPGSNVQRISIAVTPSNSNYIYAVLANNNGGLYGIYRSTNNGDTWSLRANTPNILSGSQNGSGLNGQAWYDLCIAASPLNEEEIYAGGINIWKSTNGGANWNISSMWIQSSGIPLVHADQHDLFFVPNTNIVYTGNDGGVYKTTNGGTNWIWIGSGLEITQFYRFGCSATNENLIIAGCQDNGTKLRNSINWSDIYGGDGTECLIDYSDPKIIYASTQYGNIVRSTDGSSNFTSIKPQGESGSWITPFVINPFNPQSIYIGLRDIYKSTNRGSNWTKISSFGGIPFSVLNISPSDSNIFYAGWSNGLKRTMDGGANWVNVSLPSSNSLEYMAIHPKDPKKIWIVFSGFTQGNKVYFSTNGGDNWLNIAGNLPNVPVNCVVYQDNSPDRIYIGTDIGVYYTDTLMTNWESYSDGLPTVVVHELEIHYRSGKLRAATYGRGIWQTNLLISSPVQISGPSSACESSFETFFAVNTLGKTNLWSVSPGCIITGSNTNDTINVVLGKAGSGWIKLIQTEKLTGIKDSIIQIISIYPKPSNNITGSASACSGKDEIYSTDNSTPSDIKWEVTGGIIRGSDAGNEVKITWGDPGNGIVKLFKTVPSGECSDSNYLNISINQSPSPKLYGQDKICKGGIQNYSTDSIVDVVNDWFVNGGTIQSFPGNNSVNIEWNDVPSGSFSFGKITLVQKMISGGCSATVSKYVTIYSIPSYTLTGSSDVCSGIKQTYHVPFLYGYNYKWTAQGGTIIGNDNYSFVQIIWNDIQKGNLILTYGIDSTECTSTITQAIKISSFNQIKIAGNLYVCEGSKETYSVLYKPENSYLWGVVNGTFESDSSGNSITILWGSPSTGRLKLVQTNNITNCTDSMTLFIPVLSKPNPQIFGQFEVCQGDTSDYYASFYTGYSYSWSVVGGTIILNSSDGALKILWTNLKSGSISLKQYIENTDCEDSITTNVVINSKPDKPVITKDGNRLTSSSSNGNQWFCNDSLITGANDSFLNVKKNGKYTVQTINSSGCKSEMSEPVEIDTYIIAKSGEKIKIYPNPTDEFINIEYYSDYPGFTVIISIFNYIGKREILTHHINIQGINVIRISLKELPQGIYLLQVNLNLNTYLKNIVRN